MTTVENPDLTSAGSAAAPAPAEPTEPAQAPPAAAPPAAAAPAADDPAPVAAGEPERPSRRRLPRPGVRRVLAGVAVAALLGVTVAAVLVAWAAQRQDARRTSATAAARSYALDFSTYDYRHLDADFAKVQSHLTGSFKADYASTSGSLKQLITQYRGVSTARVVGAAPSHVGAEHATVLLFLDQTVTNTAAPDPRLDRNRLTLSLLRAGDRWLVSDLQLN
jgi:Mce-associated membrane protein